MFIDDKAVTSIAFASAFGLFSLVFALHQLLSFIESIQTVSIADAASYGRRKCRS